MTRSVVAVHDDSFLSKDNFLVIEMNYAFNCILCMPWFACYTPQIDCIARLVRRRRKFDVSKAFIRILASPGNWTNVTLANSEPTTQAVHREIDGSLYTTYAILLTKSNTYCSLLSEESTRMSCGFSTRTTRLSRSSRASTMR